MEWEQSSENMSDEKKRKGVPGRYVEITGIYAVHMHNIVLATPFMQPSRGDTRKIPEGSSWCKLRAAGNEKKLISFFE